RVAGAAPARSLRVSALDHEVGDDPVEDRAGVQRRGRPPAVARVRPLAPSRSQVHEVLHRDRRVLRQEPDRERPHRGGDRGGRHAASWMTVTVAESWFDTNTWPVRTLASASVGVKPAGSAPTSRKAVPSTTETSLDNWFDVNTWLVTGTT